MIAWNVIFEPEGIEKLLLRVLLPHHVGVLRYCPYRTTNAHAQQEFFNTIERL